MDASIRGWGGGFHLSLKGGVVQHGGVSYFKIIDLRLENTKGCFIKVWIPFRIKCAKFDSLGNS